MIWIVAATMLATLIIAALVIDAGQYRQTRRSEQSIADFAALAAGPKLAASGGSDPVAACNDAFAYLQLNAPDIASGASVPCGNLPRTCDPTNPPAETIATGTGTAPYRITISYPVPYSDISDARFSSEAPEDGNLCQRMKVTLNRAVPPTFSGVIGAGNQTLTASAVVRAFSKSKPNQVAALALLERSACPALNTSGGGNSGQGVIVNGADATDAGHIQVDSAGAVGAGCTNTGAHNAGDYVIYGTALPSNGGPSIQAKPDTNGDPGTIEAYSIGIRGAGAYDTVNGISPVPTAGDIISRITTDSRYGAAIGALHNTGYAAVTTTFTGNPSSLSIVTPSATSPGTSQTISYTVSRDCSPGTVGAVTTIIGDIFFNCTDYAPSGTVVLSGNHFIFGGTVTLTGSHGQTPPTLSLPNAKTVLARGCNCPRTGVNSANNYAITVAGNLYINNGYTGAVGTPVQHCSPSFVGPGDGGTYTNTTVLATFGGPFSVTGSVYMCQTTVYLGPDPAQMSATTYVPFETTSPTASPTFCSSLLPCPDGTNGSFAYSPQSEQYSESINITGGSGYADWSAPDQSSGVPPAGTVDQLALWEESDAAAGITGQGSNLTLGVYFAPNASFTFTGQGTQSQPLHAQFISRSLTISGQSALYLVGPPNFVPTSPQTSITLIR